MVNNLPANAEDTGDAGSISGLGRSPGEDTGNPLQYSCLVKSHGQRSLLDYSLWGHKELDMTEHTRHIVHSLCFQNKIQILDSISLGNFKLPKCNRYVSKLQ